MFCRSWRADRDNSWNSDHTSNSGLLHEGATGLRRAADASLQRTLKQISILELAKRKTDSVLVDRSD
jgi:hypothetical protein